MYSAPVRRTTFRNFRFTPTLRENASSAQCCNSSLHPGLTTAHCHSNSDGTESVLPCDLYQFTVVHFIRNCQRKSFTNTASSAAAHIVVTQRIGYCRLCGVSLEPVVKSKCGNA
ncbi:hypothetical protein V5799_028054 [Amblyomma americanum]|uniref:Uncharacterized protein n=1 Tax=Amblyomma americanum TaxID=6943 RepID=A0AAQ4DDZ0_AMBAM